MLPLLSPPLHSPAVAAVGCRRHCHCRRVRKPLPPAPSAATAASVLPLFLPWFSLVMFKILLRPHNILNIICVAVSCPLQPLPLFLPLFAAGSISIAVILCFQLNGLPPVRSFFLVMFKILQQNLTKSLKANK
jgi:hypothetical protein